jgi:hypothetical protein
MPGYGRLSGSIQRLTCRMTASVVDESAVAIRAPNLRTDTDLTASHMAQLGPQATGGGSGECGGRCESVRVDQPRL